MIFSTRSWLVAALILCAAAAVSYWQWSESGGKQEREDRGKQPVLVTLTKAQKKEFVDLIEAVGTAKANESAELTAKSADTVASLNFKDGQSVPKGFLVAELTSREQSADLTAAQAALNEASQALTRGQALKAKGFVTKANIDALKAARDSASARVAAMQSRVSDRSIRTPFAGVLGLRRVSVGALVRPGDVITTIDDVSQIKVEFTVAETDMANLKPGQSVRAAAAAYPGIQFRGAIDALDTRIDPQSRTIQVRAIFPNNDRKLLPGMMLTVGIEINRRSALSLSEQSLVPVESKQFVYVVKDEQAAERLEVKIGARIPGEVEILEGLDGSENVVLEGTLRLRPGAPVKIAGKPEAGGGEERPRGKRKP